METPRLPAAFALTVPVRARWSDGDLQGVVNNAVYMTLFEEARHAYFTGLQQLEDNHFPFLLAQVIQYPVDGVLVLDTCNDPDRFATKTADLDVDVENSL